ncbi:NADH-quinone oxidoreductase subunit B [Winkia sp. ACRQY]|uniref:NADH-quinone oxidoreductase subunit B n=1 Tax=Winkia sp. ACRQY TaxID=2918182 RepID=UPI0023B816DF|nr:NADH-quinone oxidoreductase subunit B [Winkia sp. ACRQY]
MAEIGDRREQMENDLPNGFAITSMERLVGLARKASVWPVTMGLACCAIEMMSAGTPRYDISRFGMEVFRASPRHADLMIVSGRVAHKMAPIIRNVYDSMPEPKWVISMGACASTGGMFNNYAVIQGCDHVVPVDVYLPGCPPRPEALINAILVLHDQIHYQEPLTEKRRREVARLAEQAALEATPTHMQKGLLA